MLFFFFVISSFGEDVLLCGVFELNVDVCE